MGKAAMCIKMLQILNTGRIYKVSELAELLNTLPRNIIEYKKELDEIASDSGYQFMIDTVYGRHGGYKLNGDITLPALKLDADEKAVLLESFNYSITKKDFVKKEELTSAFSKIASNIEIDNKENKMLVVDKYQLQMNEQDIEKRYKIVEKAINTKRSLEISYMSIKSGEKTHIVDPYKLIIYNNSWFFLAWDHEKSEIFYFKINRINTYKLLDNKFTVYKYFKAEDYFDEQGFKNNGEYHHVVLIAQGTRAMLLKERKYGRNQTIEELEDGSVKVSLDMQNDNTMVSFALQAGSEMKILEPQWLVDKVKEEIMKMSDIYNKGE